MKSYTTNKNCCKPHKSLITISKTGLFYKAKCNDCQKEVCGKNNVTNFLIKTNRL